jgi:hypothetical protein
MRLLPIALLALLPTQFACSEELARIYVYAQRETPARSWRPIWCDGVVVAKIRRGAFFALNVPPGRHLLSVSQGVPLFVNVKTGAETFVRLDWTLEMGETPTPVLSSMSPDVARQEMRFVIYIDAKEVLSSSVSKTDPTPHPEPRLKSRDEDHSDPQP